MTETGERTNNKATFILHARYAEQVEMLNDAQAGILFRAILQYAQTGAEVASADPAVCMMFSFIRQQMDADLEKYEQACKKRSEAASRAGKISAEKRALRKLQEQATDVNDCQRIQHDNDNEDDSDNENECDSEYEYENEYENEYESAYECDDDDDNDNAYGNGIVNNSGRRRPQNSADDTTILFFGNQHWPVLQSELQTYTALANRLTHRYMNRAAGEFDIQKVMEHTSRIEYTADDERYMVCDGAKTELLQFVFERAAEQERVTWKYIDGIISNYRKRGVYTAAEAIENEYSWNRGEILY